MTRKFRPIRQFPPNVKNPQKRNEQMMLNIKKSAYGYTCDKVPENNDELQTLAGTFVDALQSVHNTPYEYGPICSTIYQTPGSSVDYAQDVIGADYVFTAELRDTGNYGFILPAEQIVPSGEETWEGVKALIKGFK